MSKLSKLMKSDLVKKGLPLAKEKLIPLLKEKLKEKNKKK